LKSSKRVNLSSDQEHKVLSTNIHAIVTLSQILQTSLGPKGLDKMIIDGDSVMITNDGATILRSINPKHPIAKLMSQLSTSQETNAGDGTTTVVLLSGHLAKSISLLINEKTHPATIRKIILPLFSIVLDIISLTPEITSYIHFPSLISFYNDCLAKNSKKNMSFKSKETQETFYPSIFDDFSNTLQVKPRIQNSANKEDDSENPLIDFCQKSNFKKVNSLIKSIIGSKSIFSYSDLFISILSSFFLHSLASQSNAPYIYTAVGPSIESSMYLPQTLILKAKYSQISSIEQFHSTAEQRDDSSYSPENTVFLQTPVFSNLINPKPWLDASVNITEYSQINDLIRKKEENFRKVAKIILDLKRYLKVNCIVYMSRITDSSSSGASVFDEKFVNFLEKHKIFLAEMDRENFERACSSFNVRPLVKLLKKEDSSLDVQKTREHLCSLQSLKKMNDNSIMMTLKKDFKYDEPSVGTFYLPASNKILAEESKRSVEDAIGVLKLLKKTAIPQSHILKKGGSKIESKNLQNNKMGTTNEKKEIGLLIKGGGVFEMNFARVLRGIGSFFLKKKRHEDLVNINEDVLLTDNLPEKNEKNLVNINYQNFESLKLDSLNEESKYAMAELEKQSPVELNLICERFSAAFEAIVVNLASNANMKPVETIGEIKRHIKEKKFDIGINLKKGIVGQMGKVEMPFGVSRSAVKLAAEFLYQVLKTNDIVN